MSGPASTALVTARAITTPKADRSLARVHVREIREVIPVVFVPGIKGSRLVRAERSTRRVVWGPPGDLDEAKK